MELKKNKKIQQFSKILFNKKIYYPGNGIIFFNFAMSRKDLNCQLTILRLLQKKYFMKKNKITGVIIARKGSRRLPNKMYRKFKGISLIELKIKQLLKTNIDEIAVGSDDEKLEKICKKF